MLRSTALAILQVLLLRIVPIFVSPALSIAATLILALVAYLMGMWLLWPIVLLVVTLLVVEAAICFRQLPRHLVRTLRTPKHLQNIVVLGGVNVVLAVPLLLDVPVLRELVIGNALFVAIKQTRMAVGNMMMRKRAHYTRRYLSPNLIRIYEVALNKNMERNYGQFAFLIVPAVALAVYVDPAFAALALVEQTGNLYTRLRMYIPAALYLQTKFEASAHEWLLFKVAAAEFGIPSMVLDAEGAVPEQLLFQQDLARVPATADWIDVVRSIADSCPLVLIDTHSYSGALGQELALASEAGVAEKVLFVKRSQMDGHVLEGAERIAQLTGRAVLLDPLAIAKILRDLRDSWMPGIPDITHMPLVNQAISCLPGKRWRYEGIQHGDVSQNLKATSTSLGHQSVAEIIAARDVRLLREALALPATVPDAQIWQFCDDVLKEFGTIFRCDLAFMTMQSRWRDFSTRVASISRPGTVYDVDASLPQGRFFVRGDSGRVGMIVWHLPMGQPPFDGMSVFKHPEL